MILLFALLWRWQGGGFNDWNPPGRRVWYVITVMAVFDPLVALCALWVSLIPHGRWFDLGNGPTPDRQPSWFERTVERHVDGDDNRMLVKCLVAHVPTCLIFPYAPLIAYGGYWLGWRYRPNPPTSWGEIATGVVFGLSIVYSPFSWVGFLSLL
jgi:hypothetical protein